MIRPLSRAAEIALAVEQYRGELSDSSFDFYDEGGQVLFAIYAASGGLAPSFAVYIKPIAQLMPTIENQVTINFADDLETINRKIKAGFAKLRAVAPVPVTAKPKVSLRPDYAAKLYSH